MAGCFGNHPFDRQIERELYRYLDSQDKIYCDGCEIEYEEDACGWDEKEEKFICPQCKTLIEPP